MNNSKKQTYALIAIAAAALVLSICICLLIYAGDTKPFSVDIALRDWFVSIRNDFLNVIVIGLTHLGDTNTIIVLCAILLLLPSRKKYGLPVSLAAITGVAIYQPLKNLFLRARPDEAFHLVEQGGYSFPSGHSVSSVIVYGLLLYLIRKNCHNEKLRTVLTVICAVLALLIGPSRLYVGVHWITDVACGMLIGTMILAISILILERMYRKNEHL